MILKRQREYDEDDVRVRPGRTSRPRTRIRPRHEQADNGVVVHHIANNPGGKFKTVSDKAFVPEQYGIVVKKGNAELLGKIDQGLAAIKSDGTYDRIYAQYFGPVPGAAAAPASAASR